MIDRQLLARLTSLHDELHAHTRDLVAKAPEKLPALLDAIVLQTRSKNEKSAVVAGFAVIGMLSVISAAAQQ